MQAGRTGTDGAVSRSIPFWGLLIAGTFVLPALLSVQPPSDAPNEAVHDKGSGDLAYDDYLALPPASPHLDLMEGWTDTAALEAFYEDPAAGGAVPLTRVAGRENERLSPRLRVRDLAARDGAPYARISPVLVEGLDRLLAVAEAPVYISSGYRYPALNSAPEIDGASHSQHMAGQAADLWSEALPPLDLAALVLDAMGCDIGLGLGPDYLHVDVRGHLASWVGEDAAMDEPAFDGWVRHRCFGTPLPADTTGIGAPLPADSADAETPVRAEERVGDYHTEMATLARLKHRQGFRGIVVLDLREDSARPQLSFVEAESPEHALLKKEVSVQGLASTDAYFVYVAFDSSGEPTIGAMRYDATTQPSPDSSAAASDLGDGLR